MKLRFRRVFWTFDGRDPQRGVLIHLHNTRGYLSIYVFPRAWPQVYSGRF